MRSTSFELHPVPPFRLDLTAWAIRRRPSNAVDRWDGRAFRRVVVLGERPVELEVVQTGSMAHPTLLVTAHADSTLPSSARDTATAILDRLLGLHVDLRPFYRLASRDTHLYDLASRFRGLKPPRFPSIFEAVANGIACQQLSLAVGLVLLNRLAFRRGPAVGGDRPEHAFPRAEDVAALRPSDLRALGYSHHKAHALLNLARRVGSGLDLESLAGLDDESAVDTLTELPGVGRWTAEYVLLRGLGRVHLFPGDDVGARTNLARWMKLRTPLDYERVRRLAHRWDPYAGLLYFHLLLLQLDEAGRLEPPEARPSAVLGPRRAARRSR